VPLLTRRPDLSTTPSRQDQLPYLSTYFFSFLVSCSTVFSIDAHALAARRRRCLARTTLSLSTCSQVSKTCRRPFSRASWRLDERRQPSGTQKGPTSAGPLGTIGTSRPIYEAVAVPGVLMGPILDCSAGRRRSCARRTALLYVLCLALDNLTKCRSPVHAGWSRGD